jgi:hypothetical protein
MRGSANLDLTLTASHSRKRRPKTLQLCCPKVMVSSAAVDSISKSLLQEKDKGYIKVKLNMHV